MTTIKLKNGSGAPLAGDLVVGEPALDLTNKRLYTEDSGGTVIEVGTNPGEDVTFADNRKAIFGAGSDLKIYHDGSDSYIDDTGTGRLRLRGAADIILAHPTNGETYATFSANGANTFYYDNAAKLATTSTGIDVTGTVTADGVSSDGNISMSGAGTGSRYVLLGNETSAYAGSLVMQAGGGSAAYGGSIIAYGHSHASKAGDIVAGISSGSGGAFRVNTSGIDSGGDVLVVEASGNVGIGTASPGGILHLRSDDNGMIFQSSSSANSRAQIFFQNTGGTTTGKIAVDPDGGNANVMAFSTGTAERMRIESDGDVHADGDVIAYSTTISDERLKTDIVKIDTALDKVAQLNGYTFTYKQDGKKSAGVIAQEVEKVLPSAVSEKELPLKIDDGVAYKTVQYDQLVGLLIEAVNELQEKVSKLEGK